MPKKLPIDDIQSRANVLHPGILLVKETYKNTHTVCKWIHPVYGEWFVSYNNLMNGIEHPEKKKLAHIERQKLSIEEVVKRVHCMGYDIDISTYVDTNVKCLMICPIYGPWMCTPKKLWSGRGHPDGRFEKVKKRQIEKHGTIDNYYKNRSKKQQKTTLEKYGVPYNSQRREVSLKMAKSKKQSITIIKDCTEYVCTASYEFAYVMWLLINSVTFKWQVPVRISDDRFVICDSVVFLNDQKSVFVEVKGYFPPANKEKWNKFPYENLIFYRKEEIHFIMKSIGLTARECLTVFKKLTFDKKEWNFEDILDTIKNRDY